VKKIVIINKSIRPININNYFDKIFYINLEKDIDRKNNLLSQFDKFGITNFERFDAISFKEIPEPKYWRNFNQTDDKYILNSLGCRASHLEIVKIAKEKGYRKILIIEDDVQIIYNPNTILALNESILNDWDFLYFGGDIENFRRNQIVCTHAYGLNCTLFDDIINMCIPSGMEMDNFYAKIMQHMSYDSNQSGLYNTRILRPFNTIVQNKEFQSNIQL
jgi:GR25 family glycosyltransferase involved in LPS biosynthesis